MTIIDSRMEIMQGEEMIDLIAEHEIRRAIEQVDILFMENWSKLTSPQIRTLIDELEFVVDSVSELN